MHNTISGNSNGIPELVTTGTDAQQTKAVDYVGLVPVLIKAMQQQQQIIDCYQDRLAKLEARLQATEDRVAR